MSTTHINCSCKHEFQDKEHGPGVRVANLTTARKRDKEDPNVTVRCTVCKKTVDVPKKSLR